MSLIRVSLFALLVAATSCQPKGNLYLTRDYINNPLVGNFVLHVVNRNAKLAVLQLTTDGISIDTFVLQRSRANHYGFQDIAITIKGNLAHQQWNDQDYVLYKSRKNKSTSTGEVMNLLKQNYVVVSNEHACARLNLIEDFACVERNCNSDSIIAIRKWYLTTLFDELFIWYPGVGNGIPRVRLVKDGLISTYCQRSGCKDYEIRLIPK